MDERDAIAMIQGTLDGHVGLKVLDKLSGTGSMITRSPGDKGIRNHFVIPGKVAIEKKCMERRADDVKNVLIDVMALRAEELLDKKEMPMHKLVDATIKAMPTKSEVKTTYEFTFAQLAIDASKDVVFEKTIDVETLKGMDE